MNWTRDADARTLLASALAGPLDARVRDLIIAETRGNPLALLELPRGLAPAELAGGFGLPGAVPLTGRIEDSFRRQLDALPEQTRRLLRLAAADPSGDRSLVWRAAGLLGIPVQAAAPAVDAGLAEFGGHVRFRHPLVRSAVYRSASFPDRQQMHAALAEATDPQALDLLLTAEAGPLDEFASARVDLLRGQVVFSSGLGSEAPPLLLKAAKRLEPVDLGLARETYLTAWMAALFAGRLAETGDLLEVSRAARALPAPLGPPRLADLILDALTLVVTGGPAAAAPALRQVVGAFAGPHISMEERLRWGWLAQAAASVLWDDDAWRAMLMWQVRLARETGALDQLPIMLGAAQRRDRHRADRAGGLHCPAGPRRAHESGDRRADVPVGPHGRMAPPQDIHQARHRFPPGTARRAGAARRSRAAGRSRACVTRDLANCSVSRSVRMFP